MLTATDDHSRLLSALTLAFGSRHTDKTREEVEAGFDKARERDAEDTGNNEENMRKTKSHSFLFWCLLRTSLKSWRIRSMLSRTQGAD